MPCSPHLPQPVPSLARSRGRGINLQVLLLLQEKMAEMVGHLASLAEDRLILSFAPSTPYFLLLKRIGEFFPKGAKVSC